MTAHIRPRGARLRAHVRRAAQPGACRLTSTARSPTSVASSADPLRLAVVGRVKSGKSTLVNALLGQRVARVDASECTRAVTWFSYGHQEQVVVHARDGRSWTRAFAPDGFLPADLGAAPEEIDAVEVVLCNAALAGLTVIDTPGLDSLTADAGARTDAFLGLDGASRHALSVADAVLFLVPQLTRDDDRRLRALADAMGRTVAASGFSPATVLAGGRARPTPSTARPRTRGRRRSRWPPTTATSSRASRPASFR